MLGFKRYEKLLMKQKEESSSQGSTTLPENKDNPNSNFMNNLGNVENSIAVDDCIHPSENKKINNYSKQEEAKRSPKLYLELRGEKSMIRVANNQRFPLTFSCVQSLILQALIGRKAPHPPGWCNLLRRDLVSQVNVVVVDGLGVSEMGALLERQEECNSDSELKESPHKKQKTNPEEDFSQKTEANLPNVVRQCLPNSSCIFPLKLEVESPVIHCDQPSRELFSEIPMSPNVVKNVLEACNNLNIASKRNIVDKVTVNDNETKPIITELKLFEKNHEDKMNRLDLLLSIQEMANYGYPLKVEGTYSYSDPEFVALHENYDEVTAKSPMFGIDCEMCLTAGGRELTRISVVDEQLNIIYTSFVKPRNAIVNYLTIWSGVTPEHLMGVETSLVKVQTKLRNILPKDCILVGHSLENDLNALKLFHPYVIDTSRVYELNENGTQSSLKLLTKLFLKKDIQTYELRGHDPAEDAAASLELALLKLRNDKNFGDLRNGGSIPVTKMEQSRIQISTVREKRLNTYSSKFLMDEYKSNVFKIIKLENIMSTVITSEKHKSCVFRNLGVDRIFRIKDVSEIFQNDSLSDAKFVVRHFRISDKKPKKRAKKLKLFDENLKSFYKCLPNKSLLLVLLTSGSDSAVPQEERSTGVLLVDVIGQKREDFERQI